MDGKGHLYLSLMIFLIFIPKFKASDDSKLKSQYNSTKPEIREEKGSFAWEEWRAHVRRHDSLIRSLELSVRDVLNTNQLLEERVKNLELQLSNCKTVRCDAELQVNKTATRPFGPPTLATEDKNCVRGPKGPKGEKGAKGEAGMALEPPDILTKEETVWAVEGENVVINCTAKGYPLPEITWHRNGNLYKNGYVFSNKIIYRKITSHVVFKNLTLEEADTYQCRASSVLGRKEINLNLKVKVKPRITMKTKAVIGRIGSNIEFPVCNVTAVPSALITWKKAYNTLPVGRYYFKEGKQILGLRKVQMLDSGYYFCEAKNVIGTAQSAVLLVIITEKFMIDLLPPATEIIIASARLMCGASGYPIPNVKWFKDGKTLTDCLMSHPESDKTRASCNVTEPGKYSCEAESGGEVIKAVTYVIKFKFESMILRNKPDLARQLIIWLMEKNNSTHTWKRCMNKSPLMVYGRGEGFNRDCQRRGPTVTILSINGNIFGGYSDVPLMRSSSMYRYAPSKDAFLFALERQQAYPFTPVKFNLRPEGQAKAIYQGREPTFGAGHDLAVKFGPAGRYKIESKLGVSYEGPGSGKCCARNWFTGDNKMNFGDMEVLYPLV